MTIPYSVQESSISPDDLFSLEPPSASSEVIEVQDDTSTKEETTNDETAEVKVEEAGQLAKTESKHKSIPRRFVSWFSQGIVKQIVKWCTVLDFYSFYTKLNPLSNENGFGICADISCVYSFNPL